jgi:hypothetical protein
MDRSVTLQAVHVGESVVRPSDFCPVHGEPSKDWKPEPYQELKQYVILVFSGLHQIQLSLRQLDN